MITQSCRTSVDNSVGKGDGYTIPSTDIFSVNNIRKCKAYVLSMQQRLDRAVADNNEKAINNIFNILVRRSFAVKILAVWKVTQNEGSKTAGVDGVAIPKNATRQEKNKIRHRLLETINVKSKPQPIRRTHIPKPNGKKRPLGIPTLSDRINQEIHRIAIEPIAEYHAHDNSYGFRPKRSCHDVTEMIHKCVAKSDRKRYILEGDIKSCFDHISHQHIANTLRHWKIPKYAVTTIRRMLKSKIFHKGKIYDTETGTPQGGVISPLLANVALTSFDHYIAMKYGKTVYYGGKHQISPMIRYADDFIILCESKTQAKEIKQDITEYLSRHIGLTLSEEKTKITHIKKGFNFLGFNIRKIPKNRHGRKSDISDYKLIIRPEVDKVVNLLRECKEILNSNKQAKQENLNVMLNQKLIGWGNYYRFVNSNKTFGKIDSLLWHKLLRWAKRRHSNKSTKWVIDKYFSKRPNRKSAYFGKDNQVFRLSNIRIKKSRHIKVRAGKRVYNRNDALYWKMLEEKRAKSQLIGNGKFTTLFRKQKGICGYCNTPITHTDIEKQETHIHHIIPKAQGGSNSYSNLRLMHAECHRETHRNLN